MAINYVSKSFQKTSNEIITTKKLAERFTNVVNNVAEMIADDGPIYHTWISFQLGKTQPIVFNTDTTDPERNLIVSLDIDKTGANCCNSFTLKIVFDPFNHGQDSTAEIEKLDDMIAKALSHDIDSNDDALRGYLQYGYSSTSANDLVSPYYEFILTGADSKVKVASGITNYTFEGTTYISTDCNFKTAIGEYGSEWKFMDVILWTLFYHYGDNANKPTGQTGEAKENKYKYRIDCPKDLYEDSPTVGELTDGRCF